MILRQVSNHLNDLVHVLTDLLYDTICRNRAIAKWMSLSDSTTVVARQSHLDKICQRSPSVYTPEYLQGRFFVPKTTDDFLHHDLDGERQNDPKGLHAKLFILQKDSEQIVLLGSSNLTDAGWNGGNVEMMVELKTTMEHSLIDSLWPENEDKQSFRYLCMPFIHDPTPVIYVSSYISAIRSAVRKLKPSATWNQTWEHWLLNQRVVRTISQLEWTKILNN